MNWTGGALQRSRNSNTKGAAFRIQKQYFARARQNLHRCPRFPPTLDISTFRNTRTEKAKAYKHPNPTTIQAIEQKRDPNLESTYSNISSCCGIRSPPHRPDRYRAREQRDASVVSEDWRASLWSISQDHAQADSRLIEQKTSTNPSAIQQKRMELLACRDWVGLKCMKPVVVHFDSIEDKHLIGKRRRVSTTDVARERRLREHKRLPPFLQMAQKQNTGKVPSTQDISVHVGSSVPEYASTFQAMPQPVRTPFSSLSEEMLLDHIDPSLTSLEKGDPNQGSYTLQRTSSHTSQTNREEVSKALVTEPWLDVRPSFGKSSQDITSDKVDAQGKPDFTRSLDSQSGSMQGKDRSFEGLGLRFKETPRPQPTSRHESHRIVQGSQAKQLPLMHGALLEEVELTDTKELVNLASKTTKVQQQSFLLPIEHLPIHSLLVKNVQAYARPETEPLSVANLQQTQCKATDPSFKGATWQLEDEELLWRRFVFGSQNIVLEASPDLQALKGDSQTSSLLAQPSMLSTSLPNAPKQAQLKTDSSIELQASSRITVTSLTCPDGGPSNLGSQEAWVYPAALSPPAYSRKDRAISKKADRTSDLMTTALSTSTGAATYASSLTITSDELMRSSDRGPAEPLSQETKKIRGTSI